jgi:hypothetical protein
MEPVTLVFQTLNEAETIGAAIREIPVAYRLNIIGLTRLTACQRRWWAPHTSAYGVRRPLTYGPLAAEYGATPSSMRSRTLVLQWWSGHFPA